MIHVRVDHHHSTAVDIYVNISPRNMITSSSPMASTEDHIYDRLSHQSDHFLPRQSTMVQYRTASIRSVAKKNYTLEQVLENVESIQKQYEQVLDSRTPSTPSCFFSMKQITKVLKNLRTIKAKSNEEVTIKSDTANKSPFIFGGETLQWIALPQGDDEHIYENEFLH